LQAKFRTIKQKINMSKEKLIQTFQEKKELSLEDVNEVLNNFGDANQYVQIGQLIKEKIIKPVRGNKWQLIIKKVEKQVDNLF